ncbi:MAG: polysaccharide export protein [Myxococcales bacterium]|jgi:protein involved in polysaccharide export with SLBB domain|nr:polysaccharide export protein [Myxococcales bacterium]
MSALLAVLLALVGNAALAQVLSDAVYNPVPEATDASPLPAAPSRSASVQTAAPSSDLVPTPFAANLFTGNFLRTREIGMNPDYVVMSGDKVAVYTWGTVQINNVFVVDGQGNIFIPEIGPVRLAGVRNADLTRAVEAAVKKIYIQHVRVYTNLLTANPVGVFVTGGVKNPGRYAGIPSDSVLFFIDQAGGIDPLFGSYRSVFILRDGAQLAEIDLYEFVLSGTLQVPQLKDNDTILVGRRGPQITLMGDVLQPSLVEFLGDQNTGEDALRIVPSMASATAVTIEGLREGLPYARTATLGEFRLEKLMDGDTVTLRDDGRTDTIIVRFEGEFDGPSMMTVRRGARLLDVLNLVPVNPDIAATRAVHIRRPSVAKAQKEAISDSLFRLERSSLLALSASRGEAEIRVREAELTARFVERARDIDPLGRVVTSQNGEQLNVILEHGDTIVIPQRTNVVRVGGEVMMAQAVIHKPGLTARDYILMAGGFSDRADNNAVIVLHADASVSVEKPRVHIQPGDQILVPPRIDTKVLQNATDVMQIIYQVAMSAAVILAL